jgi:hypothetical protein
MKRDARREARRKAETATRIAEAATARAEADREQANGTRTTRLLVYVTRDYAPGETIAVIAAQSRPIFAGDSIAISFSASYTDVEFAAACAKPDYSERPQ